MLQETHEYVGKNMWIEINWSNITYVIEYNFIFINRSLGNDGAHHRTNIYKITMCLHTVW